MATHNALLRLGDSTYLEVIASNTAASRPDRPRWFELDWMNSGASPRLATWVACTKDVRAAVARCGGRFGAVEPMSRGDLTWLITIPVDGRLIAGGVIPMLIEWRVGGHPAARLADKGCSLSRLDLFCSEVDALAGTLDCLGLGGEVSTHQLPGDSHAYLSAVIDTPSGPRSIGGPRTSALC